MKIALLKSRNVRREITIFDYKPEYRDFLYCPFPECGCKLVYVNSSSTHPYFKTHKNENHSSSCPYLFERYNQQSLANICSVKGCTQTADYKVYLYDYYAPPLNKEFMEQDFTCPYLCQAHMYENEENAIGEKKPQGKVKYLYSNKKQAQGFTKYIPINKKSIFIDSASNQHNDPINLEIINVNSQLIKYLARFPELLREIDPRRFEEIVAEIFHKKGFSVSLTPRTRDGGKDIYALQNGIFGRQLFVIECKRYSTTNKVGVELVRGIYGVKMAERATAAMLVTTSYFSKDAIDFASPLEYELSLKDFDDLKSWLKEYK
ncbi:restriction endonuclease [Paenibacillus sp. Aloe-11]|uniref:restriction endonuclease n=1 Tax=Paenibacillus sp. Aloe-11 TaxID=1050222 RepID=UPI00031EE58C|nr:restriction endonuclease [Paenibacillus sp. Aloe-11]